MSRATLTQRTWLVFQFQLIEHFNGIPIGSLLELEFSSLNRDAAKKYEKFWLRLSETALEISKKNWIFQKHI